MKKLYAILFHALILIYVSFSYSCVKNKFDLNERLSDEFVWNPQLALPIAYGDLTLADLVTEKEDTIQYISEFDLGYGASENDYVIQLRYAIDTGRSVDIMRLPIMEPYDTTLYLDPIRLNDFTMPHSITMNMLVHDNFSSADYAAFQNYEATSPINTLQHSAITSTIYDAPILSSVIDYAIFTKGTMTVTCENNFATPLMCELIVYTDSAGIDIEIATFDYSNGGTQWIPAGDSRSAVFSLDTIYVGSTLRYEYRNVVLGAATAAAVDLSDNLITHIALADIYAIEGRAVIPAQTIKMDSLIYVGVRDQDVTKKLYNLSIERGLLHYKITSTINAATHFIADFTSMSHLGNPVTKEAVLTSGKPIHESDWSLIDHDLDLTTHPEQAYNYMPVRLGYVVNTENQMMSFGPKQNITIQFSNPDSIFFSYIEGNLGQSVEEVFVDTLDFDIEDFISNFLSGEITFYDPKLRVVYDNPIGVPGKFKLNLVGKNSKGKVVDAFEGFSNEFEIEAPMCDQVKQGEHIVSTIELNKNTSNIVDFIKLLPTKIEYSGWYLPNANAPNSDAIVNCVSNKSDARLSVEAELPMKLSIKNLVLQQEIILSDINNIDNIEDIQQLRVYFLTENMFPLDVRLKVSMLDTTLANPNLGELSMYLLEAASTTNGKVPQNGYVKQHVEELVLDAAYDKRLANLLQANKLLLEVFLETDKEGDIPVIFYTYYSLKFQMAIDGKFLYKGRFSDF